MKFLAALFLFGLSLTSTQCIFDIVTTSHVQQSKEITEKKKITPKQHFCSQNKIQKLKCQNPSKTACKGVSLTQKSPICAYDKLGQKFDFNRECEACQNFQIKYYFKGTCKQAPKICTEKEECVNGECVVLFDDKEVVDKVVCNAHTDCPMKSELCIANKCIDRKDLPNLLNRAQKTHPKLAQKQEKVRKEFKKHAAERNKKQAKQLEDLRQKIQAHHKQLKSSQATQQPINTSPKQRSNIASN